MNTVRKDQRKHNPEHPATLTGYVDDYLSELHALGRSPATVVRRKDDMLALLDYLCKIGCNDLQALRPRDFDACPQWLVQQDYKPNTVSSICCGVRGFFRYLADRGVVFEDPTRRLRAPRIPQTLGLILTEKQVRRLLAEPDCSRPAGQRDRAILELLYATGMRLGECTALTVKDLDLDQGLVKVCGKGSKERLLPLGAAATAALQVYLNTTRPKLVADHPDPKALWISRVGEVLGEQSVRLAVQRHARSADLPRGTDTHALRRACATHLLRNGASPMMVARLLGHADLRTLSAYLKTSITDLQQAHARTGPGK